MVNELKLEELKVNLLKGKYDIVEEFLKNMNESKISDVLLEVADDIGICVYSFIEYMVRKTKKISWTEQAIKIMISLAYIEGSYSAALFHARELLSIERTIENLEMILFFHRIPEKLVDAQEAKFIAKELLELDPNNKLALYLLSELEI